MNPESPLEDEPGVRRVEDVRIRQIRPLISPALLQFDLPADAAVNDFVEASRRSVADVVHGRDPRLLAVVGPCSIHDSGLRSSTPGACVASRTSSGTSCSS